MAIFWMCGDGGTEDRQTGFELDDGVRAARHVLAALIYGMGVEREQARDMVDVARAMEFDEAVEVGKCLAIPITR